MIGGEIEIKRPNGSAIGPNFYKGEINDTKPTIS